MLGEAQWQSVGFQYQYDLGDLELGKALKPKNLKTKKKKKRQNKTPKQTKSKNPPKSCNNQSNAFFFLKKKKWEFNQRSEEFQKSESFSHLVMPSSLWPYGLQPARLLRPWDSLGKNTGVGCHALLQGSFQPRDRTQGACIAGGFFTIWAAWEARKWILITVRLKQIWYLMLVMQPTLSDWKNLGFKFQHILLFLLEN